MSEINLLRSLPKSKKNIDKRSHFKTKEVIKKALEYDYDYFDGDRKYGYGGYYYDGRWIKVAEDIIEHYNLESTSRVLDVGCGKAFLIKDLIDKGINCNGIDISNYAIKNAPYNVSGQLCVGNAKFLPFISNSFDLVISINTLHNLKREDCVRAIKEIDRVSKNNSFIQVDSYKSKKEKLMFEEWMLTAKTHFYPDQWVELFKNSGYSGDWYWTFV